jgi:hypothetical protein
MLWFILAAVVGMGFWVLTAMNLHADAARQDRERLHNEQMLYLQYLRDLIAAARDEIREASGKPSPGDELVRRVYGPGH